MPAPGGYRVTRISSSAAGVTSMSAATRDRSGSKNSGGGSAGVSSQPS
jgi:hypothetical protein